MGVGRWGGEGLVGLFVYAGELIEAEDGEGDGRDQHEEGHFCGGFVGGRFAWMF